MILFNITRWPAALVFVLAGSAAAFFAFTTVNLFSQASANLEFLREYGWEAVRHGALWQVGELLIWGGLSLACWLVFKFCEHDLGRRYQNWTQRAGSARGSGGRARD